jgi:hypothetical protein
MRLPVKSSPSELNNKYGWNCVFYAVFAKQTHGTIGRLLPGKEDGVFREVRADELSWRQSALRVSQFSVGNSHGKFVVEEELEVSLWFEDFVCAVVQLHLECDSYC